MNNKILFMIYNGEIKFLDNPNIDHREWYISLGGDINNYDNVIRGFVINNQLIFFKGNLSYDNEVIEMAKKCAPVMKKQLNNQNLKVCCGINPGQNGASWEPIMTLNEDELTGFSINIEDEINKQKMNNANNNKPIELQPVIDFKNNGNDPKFIKLAITFSIVILVLSLVLKIIMFMSDKFELNGFNILLLLVQIVLLSMTIVGYKSQNKNTKYIGIVASLALIFMFNIFDIILGILNLLFTIDQGYILGMISVYKKGVSKIKKK